MKTEFRSPQLPEISLEQAIGLAINEWFGGNTINVYQVLDAMTAIMASIAVGAGCNTHERAEVLTDHLKNNLAVALAQERGRRGAGS
jgi:hypothetical protein